MGLGYSSQIQQVPSCRTWKNPGQGMLAVTQDRWTGEPIPKPVLDEQMEPGGDSRKIIWEEAYLLSEIQPPLHTPHSPS